MVCQECRNLIFQMQYENKNHNHKLKTAFKKIETHEMYNYYSNYQFVYDKYEPIII